MLASPLDAKRGPDVGQRDLVSPSGSAAGSSGDRPAGLLGSRAVGGGCGRRLGRLLRLELAEGGGDGVEWGAGAVAFEDGEGPGGVHDADLGAGESAAGDEPVPVDH